MKVPNEILKNWKESLDPGDKSKISTQKKISHPIVTEAFNGEASEEVIKKINQFFSEKRDRVKKDFESSKA